MKQVLLIENDINSRPFSAQVLACLPPLPWTLSSEDLGNPNRQDLRHVRVFSVDPPGMLLRQFYVTCQTQIVICCLWSCDCFRMQGY